MPRVKQFDEQQVLEEAMGLFWKKGFHATSIQDLVSHLGINRASLYDTYGGKQELFDKAFRAYLGINSRFITEFLGSYSSAKQGIRELFENSVERCTSDPETKGCFVVNATTELGAGDKRIKTILADNRDRFEKILFNTLKKGVENGEISPEKDIRSVASFLFTLYSGLMVVAKVNPNKDHLLGTINTGLSILD
jgi:TetR/AcrR family transcriptional repressor of nem operon